MIFSVFMLVVLMGDLALLEVRDRGVATGVAKSLRVLPWLRSRNHHYYDHGSRGVNGVKMPCSASDTPSLPWSENSVRGLHLNATGALRQD